MINSQKVRETVQLIVRSQYNVIDIEREKDVTEEEYLTINRLMMNLTKAWIEAQDLLAPWEE